MKSPTLDIFPDQKLRITLFRLCHQLIENYGNFENTAILGLQPRGVFLARRVKQILMETLSLPDIPYGELDITFFRDDFRRRDKPKAANQTQIDFLIEDKRIILIDDVLYTGRSVRAAMDAMLAYGRPSSVELLVLVNRKRSRHLPIEPSYVGTVVDTLLSQRVRVELSEATGEPDRVFLEE